MKSLVIVGGEYTGSSAVFDYFSGRRDAAIAFGGNEFDAFHIQDGIASFYQLNFCGFFHPLVHDVSLERLQRRLLHSPNLFEKFIFPGGVIPPKHLVEEFLNEICLSPVNFRYNSTVFSRHGLIRCLVAFLGKKHRAIGPKLVLPVAKHEFLQSSRKFFKAAIDSSISKPSVKKEKAFVVVNQCGSFWSPDMTKLLTGADFVIRVKRNVFDHFAELKLNKGMLDVDSYLRWINATRLHEVKSVDNNVIDVFFEDLVLNFNQFKEKLLNQLSVDAEIPSHYQASISAKNVNMYKNVLSNREIEALRKIDDVENV